MEASTTAQPDLLTRDGALPVAPPTPDPAAGNGPDVIDGVVPCACCGRFPLVGERVTHHRGRRRSGWVCDRCEAGGRGRRIGPADAATRVRSLGGAMNVRRVGLTD